MVYLSWLAKDGRTPLLRPIPAFNVLKKQVTESIETGKHIHVAVGTGRMTDATTADTLAGVEVLQYIAGKTATAQTPPLVSVADPVVTLLAQQTMRNATPSGSEFAANASNVRWISPHPAAYAAGVMGVVAQKNVYSNVMVGKFGDEFLLMSEATQLQETPIPTIAASSDPNVLPYVFASAENGIWGEEMFAAGAYLSEKPMHIASVLTQDVVRWGVSVVILGGVILKAFGVW